MDLDAHLELMRWWWIALIVLLGLQRLYRRAASRWSSGPGSGYELSE